MKHLQHVTNHPHFKRYMIIGFILLSIVAWLSASIYGHYYVSTDNAYINANIMQVSPRITGKINKVYVINNDYVKKGQPLFDIDPQPFEISVASAKAALAIRMAQLDQANMSAERTLTMVKKKFSPPQDGDNVIAQLKAAQGGVDAAKADLEQALLNLQYTKITATESGWVTNVTLQVGNIVPANQPVFALISDQEYWVDANFKETEMAHIKPGQLAEIKTDMYPNHPFKGVVESISGGAGAAFSLLPPQNATGNWVKVTQRIPVRIEIKNPSKDYPLRIGSSSTVTIKLQSAKHS